MKKFILFCLLFFGYPCCHADEDLISIIKEHVIKGKESDIILSEIAGGAINKNYSAQVGNKKYFVRVQTPLAKEMGLDMAQEVQCHQIAASQGIAPPLIAFDPVHQLCITEFIESLAGSVDLSDPDLTPRSYDGVIKAIQHLHSMDAEFPKQIDVFDAIRNYQKEIPLNPELISAMDIIETSIDKSKLVPCHNDLHKGNFIDDGKKIWLVDWEMAAMGDPMFDLASMCSADTFSDAQMDHLLDHYKPKPNDYDRAKLYLFRIAADIRWGLWAAYSEQRSDIDYPYKKMGEHWINQALLRIHSQKFQKALHQIQN